LRKAATAPIEGSVAYLLPSKEEKTLTEGAITEVSKLKSAYNYYCIDRPLPLSQESFPLLDAKGEVFAMTQADASGKGKTYGISIDYIESLQVSTADLFKRAYAETGIRKGWSPDYDEARISLMLSASRQDAKTYLETLNDFIATFPDKAESYTLRATHCAFNRKELSDEPQQMLKLAMADLNAASKRSKDKAEGLYNKAKVIFNVAASDSTLQEKEWSINAAEACLHKALKSKHRPEYYLLAGDIAFQRGDYAKAYEDYSVVNSSVAATGTSYYLAAKSKSKSSESNPFEIITLLDSAASKSPDTEAAEIVLEIAEMKTQLGLYADVVQDYDRYYRLSGGKVNDAFYYYREQAKYRSDDYEGALKDIDRAITGSDGKNAIYYAEKASVCLRLKDLTGAQTSAAQAIALQSDFASAYRILGVSLMRQDKKSEACQNFNKAKELGDTVAERLMTENCK
jgi:hypothetical protein